MVATVNPTEPSVKIIPNVVQEGQPTTFRVEAFNYAGPESRIPRHVTFHMRAHRIDAGTAFGGHQVPLEQDMHAVVITSDDSDVLRAIINTVDKRNANLKDKQDHVECEPELPGKLTLASPRIAQIAAAIARTKDKDGRPMISPDEDWGPFHKALLNDLKQAGLNVLRKPEHSRINRTSGPAPGRY